ncbi:MAG: proton-conducting transporter membrane subunit, partial [Candidatus Omnitrophica bacterium]|nr:proton-conducting transporter membrane subunit [Candidatus Omnitrophota bacterium]
GIIAKAPVTGYTNLVGALSICGMPPLGGFWSKLIIILASIQAGRPALAFIAAAVSILTLAYYFRALTPALFGRGGADRLYDSESKRLSWSMGMPMVVLALLTAVSVLMLLPGAGLTFLKDASAVLANGKDYAAIIAGVLK